MLNHNEINEVALNAIPALRGMFAKMGLPDDQIDDAVQDGYIHLVTYALPRWRGEGSLNTFVTASVKRRYLDGVRSAAGKARKRRAQFPQGKDDWGSDGSEFIADHAASAVVTRAIELQWLNHALDTLTADERALCEAFKATGEWRLAAQQIGVSAPTACRMRARIQAKLAELD